MRNSIWIRELRPVSGCSSVDIRLKSQRPVLDRISDWVPIVISVVALAVAVYAQLETMRYNKLSVKPHVEFLVDDNFEAKHVGLFIENNGLGPARIKHFRVYFDRRLVKSMDMDTIFEKTQSLFKKTSPQWYTSESAFNIRSGDRMGVFFSPPGNIANPAVFRKLIDERIFVIGQACSLYDDCEMFCSTVDPDQCSEEEKKIQSTVDVKKLF